MRDPVRPVTTDQHDLPYDPATGDIVCRREVWFGVPGRLSIGPQEPRRQLLHFNIPRAHVHHSPTGWEWGYGGSGPADFALNVLAHVLPSPPSAGPEPDEDASDAAWNAWLDLRERAVPLWDGTVVSEEVWRWHQPFKHAFIEPLPPAGGTIPGVAVSAWIRAQRRIDAVTEE